MSSESNPATSIAQKWQQLDQYYLRKNPPSLKEQLKEESVGRFQYRKKVEELLKKLQFKSFSILAKLITDRFFLGTVYSRDNQLKELIYDLGDYLEQYGYPKST